MSTPFKMKGMSFGNSPMKQDKNKSKAKTNNKDILGFDPNMKAGDESMDDHVFSKIKIKQKGVRAKSRNLKIKQKEK